MASFTKPLPLPVALLVPLSFSYLVCLSLALQVNYSFLVLKSSYLNEFLDPLFYIGVHWLAKRSFTARQQCWSKDVGAYSQPKLIASQNFLVLHKVQFFFEFHLDFGCKKMFFVGPLHLWRKTELRMELLVLCLSIPGLFSLLIWDSHLNLNMGILTGENAIR